MPRNTRATTRAGNNIHEDEEVAAGVPLPETPQRHGADRRAPLGDVTNTVSTPLEEQQRTIVLEVNLNKPLKKEKPGKGKKGRPAMPKKGLKKDNKENNRPSPEVLEDDNVSQTSSAVSEACEDLLRNGDKVSKSQSPIRDGPRTPQSRAVQRTRQKLDVGRPQTPHFDPERHASPTSVMRGAALSDDSFAQNISSRSPAKALDPASSTDVNMEDAAGIPQKGATEPCNSFSQDTSSPSNKAATATTVSTGTGDQRVEALDALEDALGRIHEDLQHNEMRMMAEPDSPVKSKKESRANGDIVTAAIKAREADSPRGKPQAAPQYGISAAGRKITASKPIVAKKKSTSTLRKTSRPAGSGPSSRSTTSRSTESKPLTPRLAPSATFSAARSVTATVPAATRRVSSSKPPTQPLTLAHRPRQRPSSISKAPFVPTKSAKTPTASTFALPGEAIAARIKAQREERVKRLSLGEALNELKKEESQTPSFARKAATVRETKASRARASVLPGGTFKSAASTTAKPTAKPASATTSKPTYGTSTRNASTLGKSTAAAASAAAAAAATKPRTLGRAATNKRLATLKSTPAASKAKPLGARSTAAATGKRISSTSTTATQVDGIARSTLKSPIKAPAALLAAFEPPAADSVAPSASASAVGAARAAVATDAKDLLARAANASLARHSGNALLRARRAAEELRRAKEDGARKARAEAAEKGRAASREWAERQRVKALAKKEMEKKERVWGGVATDAKGSDGPEVLVTEIAEVGTGVV